MEYELKDGESKEISNYLNEWAIKVERKGNNVYVFKRELLQPSFRFYTWMGYENYVNLVGNQIHNGDLISAFFDPCHCMDMEFKQEPTPVTDFLKSL